MFPIPGQPVDQKALDAWKSQNNVNDPVGQAAQQRQPADDLQPFINTVVSTNNGRVVQAIPNPAWGRANGMVWSDNGQGGGNWVPDPRAESSMNEYERRLMELQVGDFERQTARRSAIEDRRAAIEAKMLDEQIRRLGAAAGGFSPYAVQPVANADFHSFIKPHREDPMVTGYGLSEQDLKNWASETADGKAWTAASLNAAKQGDGRAIPTPSWRDIGDHKLTRRSGMASAVPETSTGTAYSPHIDPRTGRPWQIMVDGPEFAQPPLEFSDDIGDGAMYGDGQRAPETSFVRPRREKKKAGLGVSPAQYGLSRMRNS